MSLCQWAVVRSLIYMRDCRTKGFGILRINDASSKGIPFGPTLWKVRGRGLDLIGREAFPKEQETNRNRVYIFLLCLTCVICVM